MPLEEHPEDFSMKLIEIKGKTWKGIENIHVNLLISYEVFYLSGEYCTRAIHSLPVEKVLGMGRLHG